MATLPPDRWHTIQARLDEVLALPLEERPSWLASLRLTEPALGDELASLLQEHDAVQQEGFLEQSLIRSVAKVDRAGQTVGAYTLLSPIGEGGMGTVWLAARADGRFERRAALKLPRIALPDRGAERFTREAQMLGRLSHPHIAQLLDAGVSEAGRPYLVLEYVDGLPIDRYCDARAMSTEGRVRLFLDVLAAVSHAHANLVVHRDIKPSNVLVTQGGEVKLLDFGVAKLLEDEGGTGEATLLTREFGTGLTLEYAAPEQVTSRPVSTATDVYSLGMLLFVLLTGRHPAGSGPHSHADMVRFIVDTVAPRPSDVAAPHLRRVLSGDLDTIVATCLKKAPGERYPSVAAFGDDLRRYLALEPILARPDSFRYRAGKFARRNRAAMALGLLGALAAVAGIAGTVLQARRASAERDFAFYQLTRAEAVNDLDQFLLSDAAPSGKPVMLGDLLARAEHVVGRQRVADASRVELLVSIGRQYLSLDDDNAASRVLTEAYRLSQKVGEPSARARAACALGVVLARGRDGDRGEALYREGIEALPQQTRFARDRVYCFMCGSEIASEHGAAGEGVARAEAAKAALPSLPFGSDVLELRVLMELAESYRMAGRQREAAAAFGQAAGRLAATGRDDTSLATTLFNNWAMAVYQLGRPLESEPIFRRAIEISRQDGSDAGVSPMLMNNYARAILELARMPEAAEYAERAQAKAAQAGDRVVVNQCLLLRTTIYLKMHDVRRASEMLDAVEPQLRTALPPGHVAFASLRMFRALVAREAGDRERALNLASEAVAMVRTSLAQTGQGADFLRIALTRRAEVELDLRRATDAASDARESIRLLDSALGPDSRSSTQGRAHLALGQALLLLGRAQEAHSELALAVDHLQAALGADHPETRSARQLSQSAR